MKYFKLFIYSAMALISVVVVRSIQLAFLTDAETGFFKDGLETIGTALSVFNIVIIALSAVLTFTSKYEMLYIQPERSRFLGLTALLAGIANMAEPILSGGFTDAVPSWLIALRFIAIIAAGGVLCWFGIAHLLDLNPHYSLSIVLVITWVARLMSTFISFTGMSNISENIYDVLMLIMMLLFFLSLGKILCGIRRKNQEQKILAIGISAVLCTAASAVPGLLVSLITDTKLTHTPTDNPVTAIFTALFALVYLVKICIDSHKKA